MSGEIEVSVVKLALISLLGIGGTIIWIAWIKWRSGGAVVADPVALKKCFKNCDDVHAKKVEEGS